MNKTGFSYKHQRGAVLAVSLILLLVLTVLGVATMDTSGLELKMASNNRDRQMAFQAAEAALVSAELDIDAAVFNPNDYQAGCSGANCFTATCNNGLCFNGTYTAGNTQFQCALGAPADDLWLDTVLNVWNDPTKHLLPNPVVTGVTNQPRYIIEFICYTEKGDGTVFDGTNPNGGAPLFRITALGFGEAGRGRVMLQSTYRKII